MQEARRLRGDGRRRLLLHFDEEESGSRAFGGKETANGTEMQRRRHALKTPQRLGSGEGGADEGGGRFYLVVQKRPDTTRPSPRGGARGG